MEAPKDFIELLADMVEVLAAPLPPETIAEVGRRVAEELNKKDWTTR